MFKVSAPVEQRQKIGYFLSKNGVRKRDYTRTGISYGSYAVPVGVGRTISFFDRPRHVSDTYCFIKATHAVLLQLWLEE